jgi:hypothetical protein
LDIDLVVEVGWLLMLEESVGYGAEFVMDALRNFKPV